MGAVDFSIDVELVKVLQRGLAFEAFVETGTFEGDAVARVLPLFSEIHSIELSETYHARAQELFRNERAVHLHHGDSATELRSIQTQLRDRSVLYWLDAHWCVAEGTGGEASQCPLLSELAALDTLNARSVVLIDDARLFLAPPPLPHAAEDWPRFQQVLEGLSKLSDAHDLMVINDIITFFPRRMSPLLVEYARVSSVDVLAAFDRIRSLEEQMRVLTTALEERLEAINELTRAADDRLALIQELTAVVRAHESALSAGGEALSG